MSDRGSNRFLKPHLWLIAWIGVFVPRRLRADWKQEWESELRCRESLLADWEKLNWKTKLDLTRRSLGAFWDALWLQSYRWEDEMIQDLRFGVRMLGRNPVMTAVVVLSLAAGIGANTAIFSVVNALLLSPLPYRAPDQLVKVFQAQPDPSKGMLSSIWSYPRFEVLRDQSQSFAAVAGFAQSQYNLTGTDAPERLQVEIVSASYFSLFGIEPAVGRTFLPEEDIVQSSNQTALVSYGLWQRRFGGDAQVIGKTLELDKHEFTIAGVLPPGFRGQDGTADAWVTMSAAPLLRFKRTLVAPNNYWFQVVARLKDGVTIEQAQAELPQISEAIEQKYPSPKETFAGTAKIPTLAPLQAAKVDPAIRKSFLILLAAVGLVLLIACANTANLLLARGAARRREFAVRTALGAGRLRLMRQMITESLLLAMISGAVGILIAQWGLGLLNDFRPSDDAQFWTSYTRTFAFFTIKLDWRMLTFNFALALATGVLFGVFPAIQSSFSSITQGLREGVSSSSLGFRGVRKWNARSLLVIGEIALSLVLLAGAALMIKSLSRLQAVNLGFAPENLVTMSVPSKTAKQGFYEQLLSRVQTLPGVEAAALGSTAPLLGYASMTVMDIEGRSDMTPARVGLHSVSPDYFKTLGINVISGRVFTEQDRVGAPRVAIINQAAAEKLFPDQDPLGKRIHAYIDPSYETTEKFVEIVGVVGDVKYGRLEEAIEPDLYMSALQPTDASDTLVLRTGIDPAEITTAVRREVLALDRNVPLTAVQTMTERAAKVTSRTRFIAQLLSVFAGLALLLAAIGIYGVIAYSISARTHELGIRMALGAKTRDVLRLVMGEAATLVIAGLALGLLAAWATLGVLQSQLYDMSALDPLTLTVVAPLMMLVALFACYIPARRATKVDPLLVIRSE